MKNEPSLYLMPCQEIILKDDNSEFHELIIYPDGQKNIKLNLSKLNVKIPVEIKCRIKNFAELEVLLCLISALHKNDFIISFIDFIYIFGMRSDRAFSVGMPNYFRDIIIPILLTYPNIEYGFHTPHSSNLLKRIKNFHHSAPHMHKMLDKFELADATLICGDESFHKNNYYFTSYYFVKKRTDNGAIDYVELFGKNIIDNSLKAPPSFSPDSKNSSIVIIDDLCDGGATFIAEAKYLREIGFRGKLYLMITHGLFTKGLDRLLQYFDRIYCTNSYSTIRHPRVIQLEVI